MHPHYILQGDVPPCSAFFKLQYMYIVSVIRCLANTQSVYQSDMKHKQYITVFMFTQPHGQNIKRSKKENK